LLWSCGSGRRPRICLASKHPGGVGAPPGRPLRAACEELADDRTSSGESAARRRTDAGRRAGRRHTFARRCETDGLEAPTGAPSPSLFGRTQQNLGRGKIRAARTKELAPMKCSNEPNLSVVIPAKRAISAFTRVYDALWRGASRDPTHGSTRREMGPGARAARSAGMTAERICNPTQRDDNDIHSST
jgi:hypothetical protein